MGSSYTIRKWGRTLDVKLKAAGLPLGFVRLRNGGVPKPTNWTVECSEGAGKLFGGATAGLSPVRCALTDAIDGQSVTV